jgi:hypothetical protein
MGSFQGVFFYWIVFGVTRNLHDVEANETEKGLYV